MTEILTKVIATVDGGEVVPLTAEEIAEVNHRNMVHETFDVPIAAKVKEIEGLTSLKSKLVSEIMEEMALGNDVSSKQQELVSLKESISTLESEITELKEGRSKV